MRSNNTILLSRRETAGETLEIHFVERSQGGIRIMQVSWGSLTKLAFGKSPVCQSLSLDQQATLKLAEHLGWAGGARDGIVTFFAQEEAVLSNLLDVCSAAGIPYGFWVSSGPEGALSGLGAAPHGGGGTESGLSFAP